MASKVDARLLKSTKFPPEFNQKVDMQKVNLQVMKKWIANKISDILGNEDDVVIELCFNLIEGTRYPDIKSLQIQLTGFLDKDTAPFCKDLWMLLLSAQTSPQGVPKELLEAKKLELMQEKRDADKAADDARRRRDDFDRRDRGISDLKERDRRDRANNRADTWQGDPITTIADRETNMAATVTDMSQTIARDGEETKTVVDIDRDHIRWENPHVRGHATGAHLVAQLAADPTLLHAGESRRQGALEVGSGPDRREEMHTVQGMTDVAPVLPVNLALCLRTAVHPLERGGGHNRSHKADRRRVEGADHHHIVLAVGLDLAVVIEAPQYLYNVKIWANLSILEAGHVTWRYAELDLVQSGGSCCSSAPPWRFQDSRWAASGTFQHQRAQFIATPLAVENTHQKRRAPYFNAGQVIHAPAIRSLIPPDDVRMADNKQGGPGPLPTLAEYKKSQARVRELIEKRRVLEKRLTQVEDTIVSKEAAYLESTPSGNIITGFDNYMKGTSGAAAQRRKAGPADQNRVFSKSSISYRPNNGVLLTRHPDSTPGSTPASHAPTPVSATFRDNGTPSSAAGTKNNSKKKKAASVADKEVEESENDVGGNKKRTNFGASRK
ncbi:PWI domain mRNA processing protein, putative [Metarhizium acridum CQMa 102]|uniref:Chromatin modification-related protein EAF6 n=1 Tax=Metarhizium acridum (strain CQMa 102) TaxID=655827 RepID=E9E5W2_METAQ|nr:PWI domain mRNA processing protein, putative [Metarhizium acridum CQMa 102]EFY88642.1 PWI domain mRNA processing protein, putative [Metarhizium acridum CQMa 102]